jgi:hypothetical protein
MLHPPVFGSMPIYFFQFLKYFFQHHFELLFSIPQCFCHMHLEFSISVIPFQVYHSSSAYQAIFSIFHTFAPPLVDFVISSTWYL